MKPTRNKRLKITGSTRWLNQLCKSTFFVKSKCLRAIALIIIFAFFSIANPAYAYSTQKELQTYGEVGCQQNLPLERCDSGVKQPVKINILNSDEQRKSLQNFNGGLVFGLTTAIGAAAACYVIDGIITAFLPSAAVAANLCPAVGGVTGIVVKKK